jgi:hypothetical protein
MVAWPRGTTGVDQRVTDRWDKLSTPVVSRGGKNVPAKYIMTRCDAPPTR